jgi:hypothetical protein
MYEKDRQGKLLKYTVTQTDSTNCITGLLKHNNAPFETKYEKSIFALRDYSSATAVTVH